MGSEQPKLPEFQNSLKIFRLTTTKKRLENDDPGGCYRKSNPYIGGADVSVEANRKEMPERKYGVSPVQKVGSEPGKCLDKGLVVTRCVLSLLKDLHQRCTKEMDAYAGCMYYYTNEFAMCRKEQEEFEEACPY